MYKTLHRGFIIELQVVFVKKTSCQVSNTSKLKQKPINVTASIFVGILHKI